MTVLLQQQAAGRRVRATGLAPGADISNHQGANIAYLLDPNPHWEYVVCRAQAPGEPASFRTITTEQVLQLQARRVAADLYDWGYLSASPKQTAANTAALGLGLGIHGIQYLDCEIYERNGVLVDPGPVRASWIWAWVREVLSYRLTPALYTGAWWVDGYFEGGQDAFSQFADDCLLWWSNYNPHMYTFETVPLPLGWDRSQLVGWQYVGNPIDLDWWDRRLLARHRRAA